VRIPAGVEDGSQLRIPGEGEGGTRGGPPGSLYVLIHVPEHSHFKRDGRDLYSELPITVSKAYLGGEASAPTLHGTQKIRIPEATQNGSTLRLKGKGLPSPGGSSRGDHIIVFRVVTPRPGRHSKRMTELFRELAELEGESPSVEERDFIDRVKDFFA
jgi:molecular chaperone DnaJ